MDFGATDSYLQRFRLGVLLFRLSFPLVDSFTLIYVITDTNKPHSHLEPLLILFLPVSRLISFLLALTHSPLEIACPL